MGLIPITLLAQIPSSYTVAAVPPISGGAYCKVAAINNNGVVTGFSYITGGHAHAITYDGTTLVDLGTLGGNDSYGYAINNSNVVVGWSYNGSGTERPFAATSGTMSDLITTSIYDSGNATAINDNGVVVGCQTFSGFVAHSCSWSGGVTTDLYSGGIVPSTNELYAINASGEMCGEAGPSNTAWITTSTGYYSLGNLAGTSQGAAQAINILGEVVGAMPTGSGSKAFLWKPSVPFGSSGTLVDLGNISSAAYTSAAAINSWGEVVGMSGSHPFYWYAGIMTDLNTKISGYTITEVHGINDKGQIAAFGLDSGSHFVSLILTPV